MPLSTHVLDTALGRPVAGLHVTLFRITSESRKEVQQTVTGPEGRVRELAPELPAGVYCMHFDTAPYFADLELVALHPFIEITFTVADPAAHLHIPLLLTANSYSTYRGS